MGGHVGRRQYMKTAKAKVYDKGWGPAIQNQSACTCISVYVHMRATNVHVWACNLNDGSISQFTLHLWISYVYISFLMMHHTLCSEEEKHKAISWHLCCDIYLFKV